MRIYNYLLFRIYRFYTDTIKEETGLLMTVASLSTLFLSFNIYTIYSFLTYKGLFNDIIPGKYYVLIPMAIIWLLNYFIFVRGEQFLEYNFKKDVKGGILIVLYILITAVSFIIVANFNREKIFKHQQPEVTEQVEQRQSLEGKVRKWWRDTF
ncbi:hypothetical protein [Pararcticibacter amylolyticus]|uniref:Uncharacterized protein n=1 Tax=Pararcticibacter amylolyticus TaxID=2173175 RepID=A0A2U2P9D7_9SPHI|nr:hypothetical protein [Pararcticibacter amylolyticus]PWG77955.1 hypothetical protein DDR33_24805 [Pararcticibacter amylolyticus]